MSQFSSVVPYLLRRYLALLIDLMAFSLVITPFFVCYFFLPIPIHVFDKNLLDTLAAVANFFTLGTYSVIVETVKFIIKLFVEPVNSMPMFWVEFRQLIKQIITDLLTTLSQYIVFPAIFVFFRAWSESSSKQASIGKRIVGLKVVDQSTGGRITFFNSLTRNALTFFLSTLSAIFVLFTKRRQAFSDAVAGAVVIETEPSKSPLLAALLSLFFFGGGGQIYNGQLTKGVALIILTTFLQVFFIGFIILILGCIDAFIMADKLRKGETIGQWQFFWSQESGK